MKFENTKQMYGYLHEDRYFYSIEDNGNEKEIHINGNIYFNDVDTTETDHRIAEWTGLYMTIDQVKELLNEDTFYEYINGRVNYLGDITREEASNMCNDFFNGEPGIELDISNVSQDTPCGNYWFESRK